jgi:NAD(P)H dehydrogenase (quinone)
MSIVVTGATGQLGRLIVERLIERGVQPTEIVAAGRNPERLAELVTNGPTAGVVTAVIDYLQPDSLALAFAGAETLVLVSGSEVGQRVQQHLNAIEAAKSAGVTRIVYTSAPRATTTALVLAPEHKATEEAIVASGIPYTILRNNWYSENYRAALTQAATTGSYVSSTGSGRIASASRDNYADAAAAVVTTPGHENAVYELSGDVAWTAVELADAMAAVLGSEVVNVSLSTEEHSASLREAGLDEGTIGFVTALDAGIRDGLLEETTGDLSRLIGRPTTPLVDTLRAR